MSSFFVKISHVCIRTYINQFEVFHARKRVAQKQVALPEKTRSRFQLPECFLFFSYRFFFPTLLLHTVCVLSQQNLDLIYCNYNTELYAAVRRANMYLYIPARYSCQVFLLLLCVLLYCCCCCAATACCCSSSCPGWQNLFLWFLASDSSVFFLFIQTRFIMYVPLGSTIALAASIYV